MILYDLLSNILLYNYNNLVKASLATSYLNDNMKLENNKNVIEKNKQIKEQMEAD